MSLKKKMSCVKETGEVCTKDDIVTIGGEYCAFAAVILLIMIDVVLAIGPTLNYWGSVQKLISQ